MKKTTLLKLSGLGALFLFASSASAEDSYAEDRAQIEDLQARYMFALDFRDAEAYAGTFIEEGVLDYGAGQIVGRQAIRDLINRMRENQKQEQAADTSGLRPSVGRHNISNIIVKIEGDRAVGRAYWFHMGNNNPERAAELNSFGHYEDELVKIDGEWLFSKRLIMNEQVADWAHQGPNPARLSK